MPNIIPISDLSNAAFLEAYAAPGRIGLAGGITLVDRVIARAQRHLDKNHRWSHWSHAFLFEGPRADAKHWVFESDLDVHRKHVRLGVQENRIDKYHDEKLYTALAVIDLGLTPAQTARLITHALDMVASRCRYSMRELLGTLIALHHPERRLAKNLLAQDECFFCSAFVAHLFRQINIDLAPGIETKNITPEDIARTATPATMYVLQRQKLKSYVRTVKTTVRARVRKRARTVANILL